ncbi:MAG: hypothetical protein PHH30_05550 [Bacteroidales bacterium]|nr:hypothetical protein [Bacteroidales bacterium]MDD3858658.1 hypothetical protein [Bacteroidales bacterium]
MNTIEIVPLSEKELSNYRLLKNISFIVYSVLIIIAIIVVLVFFNKKPSVIYEVLSFEFIFLAFVIYANYVFSREYKEGKKYIYKGPLHGKFSKFGNKRTKYLFTIGEHTVGVNLHEYLAYEQNDLIEIHFSYHSKNCLYIKSINDSNEGKIE